MDKLEVWLRDEAPKYGIIETILDNENEIVETSDFGTGFKTYLAKSGLLRWKAYLRFEGSAATGRGKTPFAAIAQALKEHLG